MIDVHVTQRKRNTAAWTKQLCWTTQMFKNLPPTLHSTSWYWCDRCVGPVFHPGQSPTSLNGRLRRCQILKYIKSGLSCLFACQFRQAIVWTMELATNAIWQMLVGSICGLERLFSGASPGPRVACLCVPVRCVGPKVSRVILKLRLKKKCQASIMKLFSEKA